MVQQRFLNLKIHNDIISRKYNSLVTPKNKIRFALQINTNLEVVQLSALFQSK